MKAEGLEGVRLQPVRVPRWVRGREWARVVSPVARDLPMLGLGMSVGTPKEGITAPVVVVRSFEELNALGRERSQGKIVAFAPDWEGYGRTVRFRSAGASAAAKRGAAAVLVRSATGRSIASPHTGALDYEAGAPRIPAAAITVEDAEWLRRMAAAGETVTVSLSMEARLEGEADSANVIAEIRGSEKPDEVVVMGGHYDSWDVGQGAHDDGCACMAAWQALTILKELGLRPRRTLRVVLWTNEENGLSGGKAYREALGQDVASHVAAIEMDGGCERPVGFGFSVAKPGAPAPSRRRGASGRARGRGRARGPRHAAARSARSSPASTRPRCSWGGGGADISPMSRDGCRACRSTRSASTTSTGTTRHADTLDKVDPDDLRRATGHARGDGLRAGGPAGPAGAREDIESTRHTRRHTMARDRNEMSRRQFTATTSFAAAAVVAGGASRVLGANDRVVLASIGIRGQGNALKRGFAKLPGVEIKTLCDVDENLFASRANDQT